MPTTLRASLHYGLAIGLLVVCLPERAAAFGWKELTVLHSRSTGADVFAVDSDDSVTHVWQSTAAGTWGGFEALGGTAVDVAAVALGTNRFEVFALVNDGSVSRNAQKPNGKWTGWQALGGGGEVRRLIASKTKAGRFELFGVGLDDAVWHRWRKGPNGKWSDWESLGGAVKQLAAAESSAGLEIFGVGTDDGVWHRKPNGEWENLNGIAKDIAVGRLPNGGMEVFVVGVDDNICYSRRDKLDAGWSPWEGWGNPGSHVAVGEAKPGVLDVFVLGLEATVARKTRPKPTTEWSDWEKMDRLSPLDVTFAGEATMSIPEFNVTESRNVSLGIRFGVDRSRLEITSFPAIETKRFDTPLGKSRSTVSLAAGSSGTFDARSGRVAVPLTLKFDQSLDVPLVEEDADVALDLSTDSEGGAALDWASGRIALAADGKFNGRGSVNPLRNKACHIVIAGALDPLPERSTSKK
jgi:hypothetical protein